MTEEKKLAPKFYIGALVATKSVAELMNKDKEFSDFISMSLGRYTQADWGSLDEEDKLLNDESIKNSKLPINRIMGSYPYFKPIPGNERDDKIWIVTESDSVATTILFPSEY